MFFTSSRSLLFIVKHQFSGNFCRTCPNFIMPRRSRSKFEPLSVKSVGLLEADNKKEHHTAEYEYDGFVVRRGFPFKLMVTLNRKPLDKETVDFELRMGGAPRVTHGTLIRLPKFEPKPDEDNVGCQFLGPLDDVMNIAIHTSGVDTNVGEWVITMKSTFGRHSSTVSVYDKLVVIFNPWCKFDPVYMARDDWREEYVLNEDGMQFYGSANRIGWMDWYFGQFDAIVLKAALKLLSMGESFRYADQSDPVLVARHMSALVNSNDDNGVLEGNWSGEYDDGKSPTDWVGSVAILKEFMEKGESVKYGQCWVFSGVLTTVMRTLGIPARSVTNFESAHDTEANLNVDYRYDVNGKPMENDDSIWNFHVWNGVWMARGKLPEGFGGWQALDATPQELSSNIFRCGPMSVLAVKEGKINLDYDGPFIYSEVNGTKKYWQKLKEPKVVDGKKVEWKLLDEETHLVGQHISTKAVNEFKREDITHEYKYKEGSKEERLAFDVARKHVKFVYSAKEEMEHFVDFSPEVPAAVDYGKDVVFTVKLENVTDQKHAVYLSVVAKTMQYNGSVVATVMDKDYRENVDAKKSTSFQVRVPASDYLKAAKGNNSLKFFFMGGVEDSSQVFAKQENMEFDKPTIDVAAPATGKLQKEMKVKVSFKNPLSVGLIGGKFVFEGIGVEDGLTITAGKVKPNSICSAEITIRPRKVGNRKLVVGFSSKQIHGLRGSAEINVS